MDSLPHADDAISVDELTRELNHQREIEDARRLDDLERRRSEATYQRALADEEEHARRAERDRAEREATDRAERDLAQMIRQTRAAGHRARISATVARSGAARALRLEKTRALNLWALVPVLVGFGAWSTAGVQEGGARLMGATSSDPTWWALWALEPVLIGMVVWVILARARLATAGGRMDRRAEWIAGAGLITSVLLNLVAALPSTMPTSTGGVLAMVGAMLAHAIGPVGAAGTALLIGVVDTSITNADPWDGAESADLELPDPHQAESAPPSAARSPAAKVDAPQRSRRRRTDAPAAESPTAPAPAAETRQDHDKPLPAAGGRPESQRELAREWYFTQRAAGHDNITTADVQAAVGCKAAGTARKLRRHCEQWWDGWQWYRAQRAHGITEPGIDGLQHAAGITDPSEVAALLQDCQRHDEQQPAIHLVGTAA